MSVTEKDRPEQDVTDHDDETCTDTQMMAVTIAREGEGSEMIVELHLHSVAELEACIEGLEAALHKLHGYRLVQSLKASGIPKPVLDEMLAGLKDIVDQSFGENTTEVMDDVVIS